MTHSAYILTLTLTLGIAGRAWGGKPVLVVPGKPPCSTREDAQAQRWMTRCADGRQFIHRYEAQAKRWETAERTPGQWSPWRGSPRR
jgi:hypothetical protein